MQTYNELQLAVLEQCRRPWDERASVFDVGAKLPANLKWLTPPGDPEALLNAHEWFSFLGEVCTMSNEELIKFLRESPFIPNLAVLRVKMILETRPWVFQNPGFALFEDEPQKIRLHAKTGEQLAFMLEYALGVPE